MNPILEQIYCIDIIPVIAIDDAEKAIPLIRSLVEGGLPTAEATFRIYATEEAMRTITAEVPEMLLGVSTVLSHEQVGRALAAGAKFTVSPGLNPDTVHCIKSKGRLILPGTATPGEMGQAMTSGSEAVKSFLAEQDNGVAKLRAIASPYKALKWMPADGISARNLVDYLSFDQAVACGGAWMVKKDLIEAENWAEITCLTRGVVDTMLGFNLAHVDINCLDARVSEHTTRTICDLLGLSFRAGNSSNRVGTTVECTKTPGPGVHGYTAIGTNSVGQAIYHLERRGVAISHTTCKTDVKGRARAVYLEGDSGGFAIYLVQEQRGTYYE